MSAVDDFCDRWDQSTATSIKKDVERKDSVEKISFGYIH